MDLRPPDTSCRTPTGVATSVAGDSFWDKHPGFIWSNRHADDAAHIRAALMRPFFPVLLDIAAHFGLDRLKHEWVVLCADPDTDTQRVEPIVSRILANLQRGYEQSTT
jgi:hypothetical protein